MMNPCEEFIKYWEELDPSGPNYIHPQDRHWLLHERLDGKVTLTAPETPRKWVDEGRGNSFQLGLFPMPYCGDLQNSDIIICLLNPGLSPADFFAEQQQGFHDALVRNISQERMAAEPYPFLFLDPQWCWTPGYQWWAKKLDETIAEVAKATQREWSEANQLLSRRIAVVELFPYHSRSFSWGSGFSKLPSCIAAKKFIQALANDPTKTIIVTRQIPAWGLPVPDECRANLILYEKGQQRGAHLSPNSQGGKAILEQLCRVSSSGAISNKH